MLLVSYGMPRSASTFVYQLSGSLIREHCANVGLEFVDLWYLDSFGLENAVERCRLDDRVWAIAKVHCRPSKSINDSVLVTATFRDPMYCAASLRRVAELEPDRFGQRTFLESHSESMRSVATCREWLQFKRVLPLHFDDITANPHEVANRLAEHCSLVCDAERCVAPFVADKSLIVEYSEGHKLLGPLPYWQK